MKNLKKVFALVLSLAMIVSTFTVSFAAEEKSAADIVEALGVIKGEGDGVTDEYLAKENERWRVALISLRLLGKYDEAIAYDGTDNFEDADQITWVPARAALAYLKANPELGWQGDGESFNPNGKMTAQQFAKVLLEILGFKQGEDFEYADAISVAVEKGLTSAEGLDKLTMGDLADLSVDALKAETKEGKKLIDVLVEAGVVTEELAIANGLVEATPDTLEVVSVEALNLREIQINFNKDSNAEKSNFLVGGATLAKENFTISEDGMTVTLFNPNTVPAGNKVKVVVKGIEGLDTAHYEVVVNDNKLPEIVSVDTVGNRLIKVTFSEPMMSGMSSISNFKINGKVKSAKLTLNDTKKVLNISLNAKLADGEYKLAVNAANVKDYAGNAIGINETDFAIAAYDTTPAYTVLEASQETVKIQFDREPKTVDTIYWKSGSSEKHSAKGVKDSEDPTIYTFTFAATKRLANGDNTVYMHKVTDYSGNITSDDAFNITATIDTERPEFVSVTQKTQTTFEFKFSKDVLKRASDFQIKDSKGVTVVPSTVAYKYQGASNEDKSIIVVTMPTNTSRSPYEVKISEVIDTTYLANKITDTIITLDINDTTAPSVVTGGITRTGNVISIVFSEDISDVELSNFKYVVGSTYYNLPDSAYLTIVGTKAVNITFPNHFGPSSAHNVGTIGSIYVSGVADLSGNELIAVTQAVNSASPTVGITGSVYAYDKNTLYVEPLRTIAEVWEGDFIVKAGSKTLTVTGAELVIADSDVNKLSNAYTGHDLTATVATNDQLIKLTLEEDLNADASYKTYGAITIETKNSIELTKDALGNPLIIGANTSVIDKIIPAAPVKDNFTLTTPVSTMALDMTRSYIADEQVKLQNVVADDDVVASKVTLSTPDEGDVSSLLTVYNVASSIGLNTSELAADGGVAGQEVFVRHMDANGNYSEWVEIGTITDNALNATFAYSTDSTTTGTLTNVLANGTQEYSIDGGTNWVTIDATSETLSGVTAANDVKVRLKAVGDNPAGAIQTINLLTQPVAPTVVFSSTAAVGGHSKLIGADATMEYSTNSGANWTQIGSTNPDVALAAGNVVLIRVKATTPSASIAAPSGLITTHTVVAGEVKVGVTVNPVVQTVQGVAEVAEVAEVATFSVTTKSTTAETKNIVINDGSDITVAVNLTDATAGTTDTTAGEIRTALSGNVGITAKYVVGGTNSDIVLTQKSPTSDIVIAADFTAATTAVIGGVSETTKGVVAVAPVNEVGTATVTAGASATGTIIVTVADGTINKAVNVAVSASDSAAAVATKIATALNADSTVSGAYNVAASGDDVVLTQTGTASDVTITLTVN